MDKYYRKIQALITAVKQFYIISPISQKVDDSKNRKELEELILKI
jgi:hypothetical protein